MRFRPPKKLKRRGWVRRPDGLNQSEGQVLGILRSLNLNPVPQVQIGRYTVDFVLPGQKAVIEVDGEPYHSLPDQSRKATVRDRFLRAEGYLPIHIWTSTLHREGGRTLVVRHILTRLFQERGTVLPGHAKFYRKLGYDPDKGAVTPSGLPAQPPSGKADPTPP